MSDPITRLNAALDGRYAIERELGEGGMATVYLADDLKDVPIASIAVRNKSHTTAVGRADRQLKPQIRWLRVFVEGVGDRWLAAKEAGDRAMRS